MIVLDQIARVNEWLSKAEEYVATEVLGGWSPADIPDLTGRTVMVTGANSGIGFETSRKLAENGAKVLMVCREMKEGQAAAMKIREEVGKPARLEVMQCDMTRMSNVVALANEFTSHNYTLDILVHVAGVFYPAPFSKTEDGIEHTLAVNYYAPTLLTLCLLDTLRLTPGSRVVFESSALEVVGRLDWNNLMGEKYTDSGLIPYGTSKLMLTIWASELSRRVPQLDVFAVHPGFVNTPLYDKTTSSLPGSFVWNFLAKIAGVAPSRGAWSTLYAATEPSLKGKSFKFFAPSLIFLNQWPTAERPFFRSGRIANQEYAWRLWEATQRVFDEILGRQAPPRVGLLVEGLS